ncbi:conserved hypothetical protein [Tenacibaculum litoreum]|uniref:hypothetical protein n=1 Tax=Tenacibaculum litoreum TaxID=321269 RepID=UPI003895F03F
MKNIILLVLITLVSCKENKNTSEFNAIIAESYNRCNQKDNCVIDMGEIFPFEWDKMYVFSMDHYPEADAKAISKITGVKYNGKRKFLENRSIIFINEGQIVYEVLTYYEPEGYIDTKHMFVEFIYGNDFPPYFTSDNSKFKLTKFEKGLGFNLEYIR